jgi:anaerobic magnesium-protoporphyrin IX monomethyl ester cyclase
MRVLLINPLSGYFKIDPMSMPPLGLLIIAQKLREEGNEVIFVDRNADYFRSTKLNLGAQAASLDELDNNLIVQLNQFRPRVVGLTTMTCQLKDARRIAKISRRECAGEIKIIAGGYHPTCEPESIFTDIAELDAIVRGQGEYAMSAIAAGEELESIHGVSYRTIEGKSSKKDGWRNYFSLRRIRIKIIHNPDGKWSNERPFAVFPARDLTDASFYNREGDDVINCYYFKKPASIVTARGCPKSCSFCASKLMEPRLYFSPYQKMIEEIGRLADNGVTGLLFYDINFPVHRKRTKAFAAAMIASGLSERVKWLVCASAGNLPYDLLPSMRKAGCIGMVFGFESASQKVLDILNKKTDVALNQKAVDACVANDIRPQSGFIIGVPGETRKDINLSLEFIKRNQLLSSLNLLLPLPGTEINKRLISQGILDQKNPDYWGIISDTNAPLTKERVYCDIPFDEFVGIYNNGMKNICAPTWKTLYIDKPTKHFD